MRKEPPHRPSLMEQLEQRLLFSAGLDVVLIDGSLDDPELLERAAQEDALVQVYDSSSESAADVLSRISQLADESGERISSVSIFSHGSQGEFALGNDSVSLDNLDSTADAWQALRESLTEDGNLYLFGCNVAEGDGVALLDALAELSGADIFASDDLSGAGGDWQLEAASSGDELELMAGLLTPMDRDALAEYAGTLVIPQVTARETIDSDADGYGNRCDGDFNQKLLFPGAPDLEQFRQAIGRDRTTSTCPGDDGTLGHPCGEFDLDGNLLFIGAADAPFDPPPDWTPDALNAKIEAGADFAQTQYCFDMDLCRRYMARLADHGIPGKLSFLIGVGPLASAKQARWMDENLWGVSIPEPIIRRLDGAKNQKAEGLAICVELIQEMRAIPGVAGAHLMAPSQEAVMAEVIAASGVLTDRPGL